MPWGDNTSSNTNDGFYSVMVNSLLIIPNLVWLPLILGFFLVSIHLLPVLHSPPCLWTLSQTYIPSSLTNILSNPWLSSAHSHSFMPPSLNTTFTHPPLLSQHPLYNICQVRVYAKCGGIASTFNMFDKLSKLDHVFQNFIIAHFKCSVSVKC